MSGLNSLAKPAEVADDVVGRQDQQDRIFAVTGGGHRRYGRGRRSVATNRLEEHGRRPDADFGELVDHELMVGVVAHHDRSAGVWQSFEAGHCLLEECGGAEQVDQVLRLQLPGDRPESGTGAPGKDDGNDHGCLHAGFGFYLFRCFQ